MSTSQVHRTGYAERPKEYFVETTVLQRHLGEIVGFTNLNVGIKISSSSWHTLLCREKAFGSIGNWMIGFAPSIRLYLLFFDLFF